MRRDRNNKKSDGKYFRRRRNTDKIITTTNFNTHRVHFQRDFCFDVFRLFAKIVFTCGKNNILVQLAGKFTLFLKTCAKLEGLDYYYNTSILVNKAFKCITQHECWIQIGVKTLEKLLFLKIVYIYK